MVRIIENFEKTECGVFREKLSEKKVHATIPKGNMGYDQYTVPDTVAVKPTFVTFLFFPLISTHKHTSITFRTILSNFFQEK